MNNDQFFFLILLKTTKLGISASLAPVLDQINSNLFAGGIFRKEQQNHCKNHRQYVSFLEEGLVHKEQSNVLEKYLYLLKLSLSTYQLLALTKRNE